MDTVGEWAVRSGLGGAHPKAVIGDKLLDRGEKAGVSRATSSSHVCVNGASGKYEINQSTVSVAAHGKQCYEILK